MQPAWIRFRAGPFSAIGLLVCLLLVGWARVDATEEAPILPAMPRELRQVIDGAAFVAKESQVVFKGHLEVYEYLLNHLDFAAWLGRALDLSDFVIEQTGTRAYQASTPRGGLANLRIVYADGQKRVIFAQGKYGRAVVVLEYASFRRADESYMTNNFYGYVRANNPAVNFLLIPFGRLLNYRVAELFQSVAQLSERFYESPPKVYQKLQTHTDIPRDQLEKFGEILGRLAEQKLKVAPPSPADPLPTFQWLEHVPWPNA